MWKPEQLCSRVFCHPDGLLTFGNTQYWEYNSSRGKRNYAKCYHCNIYHVTLSCFLEGYFRLILLMCIQRLNQKLGRLQVMRKGREDGKPAIQDNSTEEIPKLLSVPTSYLYLPSIISHCIPLSHP